MDGLITVVLEGASDFQNLQSIEFGKGFDYGTHLDIGMTDVASRLSKFLVSYVINVHSKILGERTAQSYHKYQVW